jgi:hypothetical protein
MNILVKKWFERSNQIMPLLAGLFALVLIVIALFLLKFLWMTFWALIVIACSPIFFAAAAVMVVGGSFLRAILNLSARGGHRCRGRYR